MSTVDRRRIVEVKGAIEGSGCLITDCLVLTSWKVVCGKGPPLQLRVRLEAGLVADSQPGVEEQTAEMIWPPDASHEDHGLALLRLKAPIPIDPVTWAVPEGAGELEVLQAGVPDASMGSPEQLRGQQVKGWIAGEAGVRGQREAQGAFSIRLPSESQLASAGARILGAPVLRSGVLVGVVGAVQQESAPAMVEVIPVGRLLAAPDVKEALGRAGLVLPVRVDWRDIPASGGMDHSAVESVSRLPEGSTMVQGGDEGIAVAGGPAHLRLTSDLFQREIRHPLDWLSPYTRSTRFIGREYEMQQLQALLADERPILARIITGGSGRGKTRLALELCEWARREGWDAGILDSREMERFLQQKLPDWDWQKPTLIVLDQPARGWRLLAKWIGELVAPLRSRPRLRLLLLEREASLAAGWCREVFAGGSLARALLDPPWPLELAPLSLGDHCSALFEDLRRQLSTEQPPGLSLDGMPGDKHTKDWGGDPLACMMAAMCGAGASRTELALQLAMNEKTRIETLVERYNEAPRRTAKVDAQRVVHLAACVTLLKGMGRVEFAQLAAMEKSQQWPGGGGEAELADLLEQALPGTGGIAPVLPEPVGEAFVMLVLGTKQGEACVLRCHDRDDRAVVQSVIRCAQDMPKRDAPMQWLDAILRKSASSLEGLEELIAQLPLQSGALADFHLRAMELWASMRDGPDVPADVRGETLMRLSAVYESAGMPRPALKAAQRAVRFWRSAAGLHPEAHRFNLADALSHLSQIRSRLGQREQALPLEQEAAELYRALAVRQPGAFLPQLAKSLRNLASLRRQLGQSEQALAAAQEAMELHQALAARQPEVFQPDLAGSIAYVGLILRDLDQQEQGLPLMQEAVELYRALAARKPDMFRPLLAESLTHLVHLMKDLRQFEQALPPAQEVVRLYQLMAVHTPDLVIHFLLGSFHRLGVILGELGQHEQAKQLDHEMLEVSLACIERNQVVLGDRLSSAMH